MAGSILLLDTFHESFIPMLREMKFSCTEAYDWSREEVENQAKDFDGIAIRSRMPVDKPLLQKAAKLKFIARGGAGMDTLEVALAEQHGIARPDAPEADCDAVGEHALTMLMSLMNRLLKSD